jgi:hypothetical protein
MMAIPERSADGWNGLEIQGVVVEIGDDGKATSIEAFRHPVTDKPNKTEQDVD